MNDQPNPADFALAMYDTACETHQRRDWREACHALAKALKQELANGASRPAIEAAAPMPAPVVKAAPKARKAAGPATFTMTAGSLAAALRLCKHASEARTTIPILRNVRLVADGDTLTLTTTNLDHEISVRVDAPAIGQWVTTCGFRDLVDLLAKADKSAPVTLEPGEADSVAVTIGRAASRLPDLPVKDWPIMKTGKFEALHLPGRETFEALRYIAPAMSTEATRYYLNGAYVCVREISGNRMLHIVATDGHRLHRFETPATDALPPALNGVTITGKGEKRVTKYGGLIIPRDAVKAALAMFGDGADAAFSFDGQCVRVEGGNLTLTTKIIDGSFPDYMRVLPSDHAFSFRADREELASKVRSVAAVCDVKSAPVRLTLKSEILTIDARNMDGGKATDTLKVDAHLGELEAIEWGQNSHYLRDALASMRGDVVTFEARAAVNVEYGMTEPFAVRCDDSRLLAVLMPTRV